MADLRLSSRDFDANKVRRPMAFLTELTAEPRPVPVS